MYLSSNLIQWRANSNLLYPLLTLNISFFYLFIQPWWLRGRALVWFTMPRRIKSRLGECNVPQYSYKLNIPSTNYWFWYGALLPLCQEASTLKLPWHKKIGEPQLFANKNYFFPFFVALILFGFYLWLPLYLDICCLPILILSFYFHF